MTYLIDIITFVLVILQVTLPRRVAFVPLLIAIYLLPGLPILNVGVTFTPTKILILVGLVRSIFGKFPVHPRIAVDTWLLVWAGWAFLSGFAHHSTDYNPITIRLSLIFDIVGAYFYARSFIANTEIFLTYSKWLSGFLVILALLMAAEKIAGSNVTVQLTTGNQVQSEIREGRLRASGPFGHSILAGCAGATAIPLIFSLRRRFSRFFYVGLGACGAVIIASASSGPILTALSGVSAIVLWRWRSMMSLIRWSGIGLLFGLHLVMNAPVWYLIARIDLAGGSTGWHRAELITQAIDHFNEWWLFGTDYTRHWMDYGVPWSGTQIDITNHYIKMGILGGFFLMASFIAILTSGFRYLGRRMRASQEVQDDAVWYMWCVGASIFSHCITFFSISYFDQSNAILFLALGSISGVCVTDGIKSSLAVRGH